MKVLVIVARRYNGHELWTALGVMQHAGIKFSIASTSLRIEDEVTGEANRIKLTLDDLSQGVMEHFDGLMIVSGNMQDTEAYWTNPIVQRTVHEASDKPVAAICCSVPTIAPIAGGKVVSFFPLIRSRLRLQDYGAIPSDVTISRDGNLVTAEHQMATEMWAEEFVRLLNNEPSELVFKRSGFKPKGRERKPLAELERAKEHVRNRTDG